MPSFLKGAKVERALDVDPKVYGHIPGVPVLTRFADRLECSKAGVHAPLRAGIHGSQKASTYSVVLSGGYEDDWDEGESFVYTGGGGRNTGESWSGPQYKDQEWVRGNKGLQLSQISGKPVRVVRGHKLPSRYAPAEGYRYDGLYKVTEATRAVGKTGFKTCQFTFQRMPGQPPLPGEVLHTKKEPNTNKTKVLNGSKQSSSSVTPSVAPSVSEGSPGPSERIRTAHLRVAKRERPDGESEEEETPPRKIRHILTSNFGDRRKAMVVKVGRRS